ncbi:MAG: hypothetical protein AAF636_12340 [Pseudomonadota bacterium]
MKLISTAACVAVFACISPQVEATAQLTDTMKISRSIIEKAEERGLVRVIVLVDHASDAAVAAGSTCVNDDCAKLEVANAMLSSQAPFIQMLPDNLLVMETTVDGLDVLQRLPQVVSVTEDGADPTNHTADGIDAPFGE